MPPIGWTIRPAGGDPAILAPGVPRPPIAPRNITHYAGLRAAHTCVALALDATIPLHVEVARFPARARRDGVFAGIAHGPSRPRAVAAPRTPAAHSPLPRTRRFAPAPSRGD